MSSAEFIIDPLNKSDYDKVFDFMQEKFRIQEPITSALDTSANDSYIFYKDLCSFGFKTEKTSLVVRNSSSEIIGIALNGLYNYDELPKFEPVDDKHDFTNELDNGPYPSRNANRLVIFIEHVESGLFKFIPSDAKIFKCDILCVRDDYYKKGIGSKLILKSIELARHFNCTHCVTCATAQASQTLFERHGFEIVREVAFKDFLDNNDPVYLKVPDGGKSAKLMIHKL